MNEIVVRADSLSKLYRIGTARVAHRTAHEVLADLFASPIRLARRLVSGDPALLGKDTIWALKDVSFEVRRGEVLGIIGRNGAGKSTLLRILSRITKPTSGTAVITGRVGSLLEVGTGFHPELTGRENIYLNGAILGMKRQEIARKFDEIVAFSEIERFLDTPVKHYSSGMYVRLAFAVAAHLEPEILIVDEVLAVGDVTFQRKCLGKMGDVAREGRTVLFVSHNMEAVERLCSSAVVLSEGGVDYRGEVTQAVAHYLRSGRIGVGAGAIDLRSHPRRRPESAPVIRGIRVLVGDGKESSVVTIGERVVFEVQLDPGSRPYPDCAVGINILSLRGQLIVLFRTKMQHPYRWSLSGPMNVRAAWDECNIAPGGYLITVAMASADKTVDWIDEAFELEVRVNGIPGKDGCLLDTAGVVVPRAHWEIGP
jgi:lipopolysaccharide transport system ATP-binding protein